MNDRALSLLGICRKAGKLGLGNEAVIKALRQKTAHLLIFASDISANTERKLLTEAQNANVLCVKTNYDQQTLGDTIGQYCVAVSVNDVNLAEGLKRYILIESEE